VKAGKTPKEWQKNPTIYSLPVSRRTPLLTPEPT
jgi:hypothetical protein